MSNNAGKKADKFTDDSNDNASMDELIASLGKGAGDDESNRFKNQAAFTQEQADINETENDVESGEEKKDAETIKRERDDEIDKLDNELQSLLAFLSHATKGSEKLGSETKKYEDGLKKENVAGILNI